MKTKLTDVLGKQFDVIHEGKVIYIEIGKGQIVGVDYKTAIELATTIMDMVQSDM